MLSSVGRAADFDSEGHRPHERPPQKAGLIGPDSAHDAAYFDALPDVLDWALKALPGHRYDAIVVDEGQDLDQEWWLPLLDLLRDRERGIVSRSRRASRRLGPCRNQVR